MATVDGIALAIDFDRRVPCIVAGSPPAALPTQALDVRSHNTLMRFLRQIDFFGVPEIAQSTAVLLVDMSPSKVVGKFDQRDGCGWHPYEFASQVVDPFFATRIVGNQ